MELRNFIKEALKDILGGIEDAQSEITSGEIVPQTSGSFKSVETGISNIQPVEFEVTDSNETLINGRAVPHLLLSSRSAPR